MNTPLVSVSVKQFPLLHSLLCSTAKYPSNLKEGLNGKVLNYEEIITHVTLKCFF